MDYLQITELHSSAMASYPLVNCTKCMKVFRASADTPLTTHVWESIEYANGVCPQCASWHFRSVCKLPHCNAKADTMYGMCRTHLYQAVESGVAKCAYPWCREPVYDNGYAAHCQMYCDKHECATRSITMFGTTRCPFQAMEGKSLCTICHTQKNFVTALRLQLALSVGRFACEAIITAMKAKQKATHY